MAIVGYARVSSIGQSLEIQLEKLKAAGAEKVYSEKKSGSSAKDREQLQLLLDYVREGDTVLITKLDRMGRSLADLLDIVNQLESKGVKLHALDQSLDTGSAQGKLMLSMLGAFAEFELSIRKERQMEGIAKAKEEGRYKGRPVTIDEQAIREALATGLSTREVAKKLEVGKSTVHRIATKMKEEAGGNNHKV